MHELLLVGQVPEARHEQLLKILAGVTAMQPDRVIERHILYNPLREPEEPGLHTKRGGTQDIAAPKAKSTKAAGTKDLYTTQIVCGLDDDNFKTAGPSPPAAAHTLTAGNGVKWTWVFMDVPEAGPRGGVTVRSAKSTDIIEGDAHAYMVSLGQQYRREYYLAGHRFVHENIIISLFQLLFEETAHYTSQTSPKDTLPSFDSLELVDPSGTYIIEAKLRVVDMSEQGLAQVSVEEMNAFKTQMKGCVNLVAPDRHDLDYRVKYKPKGVPVRVK